jgi:hypothetical protein
LVVGTGRHFCFWERENLKQINRGVRGRNKQMRQMHLLLGLLGRNFYASLREKSNDLIVVFELFE